MTQRQALIWDLWHGNHVGYDALSIHLNNTLSKWNNAFLYSYLLCIKELVYNHSLENLLEDIPWTFVVCLLCRLYSDYIYEAKYIRYNTSSQLFHKSVIKFIERHSECRRHHSRRACAYNASLETYEVSTIHILVWFPEYKTYTSLVSCVQDIY